MSINKWQLALYNFKGDSHENKNRFFFFQSSISRINPQHNNELGEPVASGVYFYTLTADDFTATRKMLIRK